VSVVIPPLAIGDLKSLPATLAGLGYTLIKVEKSEHFDNFIATFSRNGHTFSVVRDRGQFHVSGNREALKLAGLWRSFSGIDSLEVPLISWLVAMSEP
jgi:hypothetical protein